MPIEILDASPPLGGMITQKTATVKDWRTIAGGEPAAETGDIRYKGATIQQRTGNAVENGSAVAPFVTRKEAVVQDAAGRP